MTSLLSRICLSLVLLASAPSAFALVSAAVFQNGPAFIIDEETLPGGGHASAELGGGGTDGAGSFTYVGSAYAATGSGSLGVAAVATGSAYPFTNDRLTVHSLANLSDTVTFSGAGPVTVRLAVQGSFASVFGGQMSSFATLSVPGTTTFARTFWRGGSTPLTLNVPAATVISDLPANYIVWLEGVVDVPAGIPVPLSAHLEVFITPPVDGTAQALFDHTAQFFLFMPEGVTFTSESGDFLAGSVPVGAVPEPGIAGLFAGGLLAAFVARRRASAAQRPARGRAQPRPTSP